MPKRKILIVDDHPPTSLGLKLLLNEDEELDVIAIAATFEEGLKILKEKKPELIILDNYLPDANAIDSIPRILEISKNILIAMYSSDTDIDLIIKAFRSGAKAYISKRTFGNKLKTGIKCIFNDGIFLDTEISKIVMDRLLNNKETKVPKGEINYLTNRELEILKCIAEAKTTQKISDELFISKKTVENHRLNIMNKLNIGNSNELFFYAVEHFKK